MSKAPPAAPPAPSPEELAAKKAAEDKQKEKEKKAKAEKEAADAAREAELEKKKKAAEAAAAAELEKKKKEAAAQEAAEQAAAAKKKADEVGMRSSPCTPIVAAPTDGMMYGKEEAAKKKALADADAASAAKEAMEKSSNLKLKIAHFKKCNKELQVWPRTPIFLFSSCRYPKVVILWIRSIRAQHLASCGCNVGAPRSLPRPLIISSLSPYFLIRQRSTPTT